MYITKIELKDIRCFEVLILPFDQKGKSILISGDNGDGKSTILRCIAIGLCDESSASALHRELPGDFIRRGAKDKKGSISIELEDDRRKRYKIFTEIIILPAFEKIIQTVSEHNGKRFVSIDPKQFPWHKIFVSAYGAGIRTIGTDDFQHYLAVDAVYPLFKYDVELQNPELVFYRAKESARERGDREKPKKGIKCAYEMENYLKGMLKRMLNLEDSDEVRLSDTGVRVKTKKWGDVELGALGDGYKATVTWAMDLFSWWLLYVNLSRGKNIVENREIKGIVIFDEIEQHLHPRWQLKIMGLIKESFSKVQFIASTHSPLVISGRRDVPVKVLGKNREKLEPQNVSGWLAEDVYQNIMDLPSSRSDEKTTGDLEEYKELHLKKLRKRISKKELSKLNRLKHELIAKLPESDPVVMISRLGNIARIT